MTAQLISKNGTDRIYKISTGEKIKLILDEDELSIKVFNSNLQEIGEIVFREIETDYFPIYKLKWAYLDKLGNQYKNQGLGRACVEFFNDFYNTIIIAQENDGQQQDDGSHLTGDAPGFVQKLKIEGLIKQ